MKHASYCQCFKRCDFDLLNLLTTIVYNQDSISVLNKQHKSVAVMLSRKSERLLNEIYYNVKHPAGFSNAS